jgi:hypothetical protein
VQDVASPIKFAANLLEDGTDETLWAAAHLVKKLPESERLSTLYAHVIAAPRSGSQHVVDQLAKICPVDDPRRTETLKWALLNGQVETAEVAVKWARDLPNAGSEAEATTLLEAFDHSPKGGLDSSEPPRTAG